MFNFIVFIFEKIGSVISWIFSKIIDGIAFGITRFVGQLTIAILVIILGVYIGTK